MFELYSNGIVFLVLCSLLSITPYIVAQNGPHTDAQNTLLLDSADLEGENITDTSDAYADCFHICPTWSSVAVICLAAILLCCMCSVFNRQQPREIWYVVDRNASTTEQGSSTDSG